MAPDVIVDGESGFIVEVGDVDGMVARAEHLLDDASLRQRVGEAGVSAAQRYAWPIVARAYERLYRSVSAPRAE